MSVDASRVLGHKEWARPTGRKVDPRYDMAWRRNRVRALATTEEDDVLTEADIDRIADRVWTKSFDAYLQRDAEGREAPHADGSGRLQRGNYAARHLDGMGYKLDALGALVVALEKAAGGGGGVVVPFAGGTYTITVTPSPSD